MRASGLVVVGSHCADRPVASDPEESVALRDVLWRALGDLPPRMRAVVVLRFVEDQTEAETARTLGCSVGSVKSQASRGVARLREVPELHGLFDLVPGRGPHQGIANDMESDQ